MGRPRRVNCRQCDRHIDECGPLSARALCEECGLGNFESNLREMIMYGGATNEKWRRKMRAYGQALVETLADDA